MTFLPFLLNRSKLPICSYNLFLFWPITLKSVKKKKKYLFMCINKQKHSKKKKNNIFVVVLKNKIKKKKKKVLFFSILACNTSNTKWLIYSLSQHLTRLANDFPAFFA